MSFDFFDAGEKFYNFKNNKTTEVQRAAAHQELADAAAHLAGASNKKGYLLVAEQHICYFVNPLYVNGKWINVLHEIKRRKYVDQNTTFYTFEYVEEEVSISDRAGNLLQPIFDNIDNTEKFIRDFFDKVNA